MKKIGVVFFAFTFSLGMSVYGQDNPEGNALTSDQIQLHAEELGIPYDALRQLINSHRTATMGLSNPGAEGARFVSIREFNFMRESDMLSAGAYYIVHARYSRQNGRRVFLWQGSDMLGTDSNFLVNIPEQSDVIALIGVRPDTLGRPREYFLVELVLR